MVAHDDGSACAAWNAPVMMYDPSLEVCLLRWPKDYIDRSLAGDLCNRLSPTTGKRAPRRKRLPSAATPGGLMGLLASVVALFSFCLRPEGDIVRVLPFLVATKRSPVASRSVPVDARPR
jgi:hypothetical protein